MDTTKDQALLLEALSDKMLHQLPQAVWRNLFLGPDRDSIRFEERNLSIVHADADVAPEEPGGAAGRFCEELQRLNAQHGGRLDPYVDATALITFEDPGSALRMALQLQRAAAGMNLRIGVASGPCMLAFFRAQGRLWCTPLGAQPARAAEWPPARSPAGSPSLPRPTIPPNAAHACAPPRAGRWTSAIPKSTCRAWRTSRASKASTSS